MARELQRRNDWGMTFDPKLHPLALYKPMIMTVITCIINFVTKLYNTSALAFVFHLCTVSFLVDSFSPQCPPLPLRRFLPHPPPHCCLSNWLTQPHNSCRVGVLQITFPRGSPQIINISTEWLSRDCTKGRRRQMAVRSWNAAVSVLWERERQSADRVVKLSHLVLTLCQRCQRFLSGVFVEFFTFKILCLFSISAHVRIWAL